MTRVVFSHFAKDVSLLTDLILVEHYWLGTILSRIKLLEHKSQSLHPTRLAIIQRTLMIKPRTPLMTQRLGISKIM